MVEATLKMLGDYKGLFEQLVHHLTTLFLENGDIYLLEEQCSGFLGPLDPKTITTDEILERMTKGEDLDSILSTSESFDG